MNTKKVTAFGIAVTIIGSSVEGGEPEWCRPVCEWIVEQPHVPHGSHEPTPTAEPFEFVTSGSSSADVPFVPYDSSAADIALRRHHDRRRAAQTMISNTAIRPSLLLDVPPTSDL